MGMASREKKGKKRFSEAQGGGVLKDHPLHTGEISLDSVKMNRGDQKEG